MQSRAPLGAAKIPRRATTVSVTSLGCPRTLVDSELYLGRLKQCGFEVVDEIEDSDVLLINTCGFIQDAIKESLDTILKALEMKRRGRLGAVVVAGCLVQRFKQDIASELPEIDAFVGLDGFDDIDLVVRRALNGRCTQGPRSNPCAPHRGNSLIRERLSPHHYAYLKISEGCLKGCSFCVIPRIKGPLRSRPIKDLLDEARGLVEERGAKELILVGQDTSDYGRDLYGEARIAELLGELAKIAGLRWIRLLYCHPKGISRDLIETIRDEPVVCNYLDMAIEHADDRMLRRMNRNMTRSELRERILCLREEIPGIALRSSVIVGFPGETDAAFESLLSFLNEISFERLGAFQYSRETGTAAFGYADQVPGAVSRARFDRLMLQQQAIASRINARWVGRSCEVVIDEVDQSDPTEFLGRTSADCPEVDGQVFVHSRRPLEIGGFVRVGITGSYEYDLVGSAVRIV